MNCPAHLKSSPPLQPRPVRLPQKATLFAATQRNVVLDYPVLSHLRQSRRLSGFTRTPREL